MDASSLHPSCGLLSSSLTPLAKSTSSTTISCADALSADAISRLACGHTAWISHGWRTLLWGVAARGCGHWCQSCGSVHLIFQGEPWQMRTEHKLELSRPRTAQVYLHGCSAAHTVHRAVYVCVCVQDVRSSKKHTCGLIDCPLCLTTCSLFTCRLRGL